MRVGIAGSGFMSRTHAKAYADMNVDIVAVSTPSGPETFIDEFDLTAEAYTDVEEMCEQADIDYLDICTPTHTHANIVRIAAEANVDIFLEKPIAGTLAEANEIAEIVDDAGLTCMVGHVVRYIPSYRKAKNLEIGSPGVARARRFSQFPDWGSNNWFAKREKSGGIFVDLAIHDFDYLRWCWGDVERMFARCHRDARGEHVSATLRFKNGAVGVVESSWYMPSSKPFLSELELAGDDGVVEFSSEDHSPYREWTDEGSAVKNPVAKSGYRRELEHFVSCLESDIEPDVTAEDATESLRLALAAERSAQCGKPVRPEELVA